MQEELKTDSVWKFKDVLYEVDFAFYGKVVSSWY